MDVHEQLALACGSDTAAGYRAFQLLRDASAKSAAAYDCFDELSSMLQAGSSYERTRGFLLIAANARWDTTGRIATALDQLTALFHDEKPTVVRQCVQAAPQLVAHRPELAEPLAIALESIDAGRYRDSMQPLIARDVADALAALGKRGTTQE